MSAAHADMDTAQDLGSARRRFTLSQLSY